MNHSIVRWLTVPDTWDFVDKKKPSVENPKKNRTASSFAISIWNEDPDIWEHDYVMPNKPPALHKINLSKTSIWAGEEGLVKISFEVTDEDGEDIQYKVLINNEEAIPLTNFYPTPAQIEASIPITRFNEKENLLELIVIDELGLETHFNYIIKKENRDTFTFKRVFDFKEDYITDENIEVIYGEGLALKEIGTGEVNIEIPTEGKAKIKNIEVVGAGNQNKEPIIPTLTSNSQDGYEVSASSINGSSFDAWKSFDDKNIETDDCWISNNESPLPQWIQIKLPVGEIVSVYAITSRNYPGYVRPPKSWQLQGSLDGINWIILDERKDMPNWRANETRIYNITSDIDNYLYYRLVITDKHDSVNFVAIGELQLYKTDLDTIEEITIDNPMTYIKDLGAGKVYESRLLTEYSDIMDIRTSGVDGKVYDCGENSTTNPIEVNKFSTGTVTFEDEYIYLTASNRQTAVIATRNAIDLSKVSKVVIDNDYNPTTFGYQDKFCTMSINKTIESAEDEGVRFIKTNSMERKEHVLNVADLEGEFYIKISVNRNTPNGSNPIAKIHGIYLLDADDKITSGPKHLCVSNNKYLTYRDNEFIEVEPTVENFEEKSINLPPLATPTDKVVLTMEGGYELEDGKIYRKTINTNKYKRIIRVT